MHFDASMRGSVSQGRTLHVPQGELARFWCMQPLLLPHLTTRLSPVLPPAYYRCSGRECACCVLIRHRDGRNPARVDTAGQRQATVFANSERWRTPPHQEAK
jgi:hypothetical protein